MIFPSFVLLHKLSNYMLALIISSYNPYRPLGHYFTDIHQIHSILEEYSVTTSK